MPSGFHCESVIRENIDTHIDDWKRHSLIGHIPAWFISVLMVEQYIKRGYDVQIPTLLR